MMYDGHYFWGMDFIWWFIWLCFLIWIFATPYSIPGERRKKDSALDLLKKQLASNQISIQEYEQKTQIIE